MRRYKSAAERKYPMTHEDFRRTVEQAPTKAANIFSDHRSRVQAIQDDHLIPDSGKLIESGRLQQEALKQVQQLGETVAVASDLALKKLAHDRDAARPKVDADTWSRKARHFEYLVSRGIDPETLAQEIADPVSLRVAQDEMPILARGQSPLDPKAGEGVSALLEQKALSVYGDDYRAKADELKQFDRGAYRAQVALSGTIRQIREAAGGNWGDLAIPSFTEGDLVEV
jgi:hypothetical protein